MHTARTIAATLVACALVAPGSSASAEDGGSKGTRLQTVVKQKSHGGRLPAMQFWQAKAYTRRTLLNHRRFGNTWRYATTRKMSCRRLLRTRFRCAVAFGAGDVSYRGGVKPFYSRTGSDPWYARYRIVEFDEYCYYVHERSRDACSRVFSGIY